MMPLNKQKGFALLMSLIVVSVVISVGLTILELTLKQVRLSTNSKESEMAFHAANAGLECAQFWQADDANSATPEMETGGIISPECFGFSVGGISGTDASTIVGVSVSNATAYQYVFQVPWGTRCSKINIIAINSVLSATGTVSGMETLIPGYAYGNTKECESGARCSVMSVQGYSRACSEIGSSGTVQREVLLEL